MQSHESPFNTVPPMIAVLAVIIMGIEVLLTLGSYGVVGGREAIGWRVRAFEEFGFAPGVWEYTAGRGLWTLDLVKRFVTYAFVQTDFIGALFGAAMLLALGKFVGDWFHWAAALVVILVSTVGAAVIFGIAAPVVTGGGNPPLIGVFPAVYGLIGAFTYIMWLRLGQMGANQLAAFRLIGWLMLLQLIFGLFPGQNVNWIGDVAGFVIGLAISPFVAPGGWSAFVARMRAR